MWRHFLIKVWWNVRFAVSPIYIHPFSCPSVCPTNDTIEDPRDLTTGWNSGVKFYKFNFEKENFKSEPKFNFSKNEQETRMKRFGIDNQNIEIISKGKFVTSNLSNKNKTIWNWFINESFSMFEIEYSKSVSNSSRISSVAGVLVLGA